MSLPFVNPSVTTYHKPNSLRHISAHGQNLSNKIRNEKPHSPSQTRKRIAEQLYKASIKGHHFINEHHCITKRCSNPGCGAFLRTAGQHICVHVHQSRHSRGGRRALRIRRTLRIRR
jgi:hypothetical protein